MIEQQPYDAGFVETTSIAEHRSAWCGAIAKPELMEGHRWSLLAEAQYLMAELHDAVSNVDQDIRCSGSVVD